MAGAATGGFRRGKIDEGAGLDVADAGEEGRDLEDEVYDCVFVVGQWGVRWWGRGYEAVEAQELHDDVDVVSEKNSRGVRRPFPIPFPSF